MQQTITASPLRKAIVLFVVATLNLQGVAAFAQTSGGSSSTYEADTGSASGPIRLRQPQSSERSSRLTPLSAVRDSASDDDRRERRIVEEDDLDNPSRKRYLPGEYRPGEFERYVQKLTRDRDIRRFGSDLALDNDPMSRLVAGPGNEVLQLPEPQDASPAVPSDYVIQPGDEVQLQMWGSVDADLRLVVDRSGRISIPRVGSVMVAGTHYADLAGVIDRQARKVFRNYELSVSLGQLRGVRVFVTGYATRPGVYSASSLATISSVLFGKAGGPSSAGSFRDIELRRAGKVVSHLDLYDLLITGRREADQLVQAGDVIHVGSVGPEVALIGSVNKQAIFELKPGETLTDLVAMGGGFNSVADRSRVAIEKLDERSSRHVRQLSLPADQRAALDGGDVVRVFSAIAAEQPLERQARRVRIEGEVLHPGEYVLPPGAGIHEALRMAGGTTPLAYVFGTELDRESVRKVQQQNYDRMLREIELQISTESVRLQRIQQPDETPSQTQKQLDAVRLLKRLQDVKPSGRMVLDVAPDSRELPDLALEDGDRLLVPAAPSTVGVFGSVFSPGSFAYQPQRTVDDYLRQAGSAKRFADTGSLFVVRANGSVISNRQKSGGWFGVGSGIEGQPVYPGDTLVVPDDLSRSPFVQEAKDWTQVLYQLGVGLAAIATIRK